MQADHRWANFRSEVEAARAVLTSRGAEAEKEEDDLSTKLLQRYGPLHALSVEDIWEIIVPAAGTYLESTRRSGSVEEDAPVTEGERNAAFDGAVWMLLPLLSAEHLQDIRDMWKSVCDDGILSQRASGQDASASSHQPVDERSCEEPFCLAPLSKRGMAQGSKAKRAKAKHKHK